MNVSGFLGSKRRSFRNENKKHKNLPSIVVIISSFNNSQWVEKNLGSLFEQEYPLWRALYDDLVTFIMKDTMRYVMVMRADSSLPMVYHDLEVMAGLTYARAFYGALTQESFTQEVGAPLNYVQDGVYAWQFSHDKRNAHTFIEKVIDEHHLPISYEVVHEPKPLDMCFPSYCGSRQVLYKKIYVEEYMKNLPRKSFDDFVDNFMDSSLFSDDIGLVCW